MTSFAAARRLIRTEGILCGGSSGSAISSALSFLKSEEGKAYDIEGKNVVILLADSYVWAAPPPPPPGRRTLPRREFSSPSYFTNNLLEYV